MDFIWGSLMDHQGFGARCRYTSRNISAAYPSGAIGMCIALSVPIRGNTYLTCPPPFQYLIMNLGMSENFGVIDFEHLTFPATMRVDWIRVYQAPSEINVGCNPKDFPTEAYIEQCVSWRYLSRFVVRVLYN